MRIIILLACGIFLFITGPLFDVYAQFGGGGSLGGISPGGGGSSRSGTLEGGRSQGEVFDSTGTESIYFPRPSRPSSPYHTSPSQPWNEPFPNFPLPTPGTVPVDPNQPEDEPNNAAPFYCGPNALCGPSTPAAPVKDPQKTPPKTPKSNAGSNSVNLADLSQNSFKSNQDLRDHSYPFAVALLKDGRIQCSGTLIGKRQILTAAHCVCKDMPDQMFLGASIFAGDPTDVGYKVKRYLKKDATFYDNNFCKKNNEAWKGKLLDLAIVETESPLDLPKNFFISPNRQIGDLLTHGIIVGFGASNQSNAGGVKRFSKIEAEKCNFAHQLTAGCIRKAEYVAINQTGNSIDTCKGDSGGPLLSEGPFGIRLAGITSRKISQSKEKYCGSGGVYVRINAPRVKSWLIANVR